MIVPSSPPPPPLLPTHTHRHTYHTIPCLSQPSGSRYFRFPLYPPCLPVIFNFSIIFFLLCEVRFLRFLHVTALLSLVLFFILKSGYFSPLARPLHFLASSAFGGHFRPVVIKNLRYREPPGPWR